MFNLETQLLIVDDMLTMRKIVRKTCQEIGFSSFVEADDGEKAWSALNDTQNTIGLVISDWNMPNCTGLDLLKRVRADDRFKELPFLMVTAETEMNQVKTAIQAGVDSFVVKPFSAATLREKLEAVHKKRAA